MLQQLLEYSTEAHANQNIKLLTKFGGENIDGANKYVTRTFKIGIVDSGELIHEFEPTLGMSQFFDRPQNGLIATYLFIASNVLHGYKLLLSIFLFNEFIQAGTRDSSREAFAPPNSIDQSSQVRRNLYSVRIPDNVF